MEARIIHTKIWTDDYFVSLSSKCKLLYIWLLSNEYIDSLGMIEVNKSVISKATDIREDEVNAILQKFIEDEKIDTFKSYIYVKNAYKYQSYIGVKNANPKLRTIYEMSDDVILYFKKSIRLWLKEIDSDVTPYKHQAGYDKLIKLLSRVKLRFSDLIENESSDTQTIPPYIPKDTPSDGGQKPEIRNQNSETKNQEPETPATTSMSYTVPPVVERMEEIIKARSK